MEQFDLIKQLTIDRSLLPKIKSKIGAGKGLLEHRYDSKVGTLMKCNLLEEGSHRYCSF